MLFKEFKERNLFENIDEIVINKKINIRGKEVLLLSLIKYGKTTKLWTLSKNTFKDEEYESYYSTNREEQISHIKMREKSQHIHISKMVIQDKEINFTSSQGISIEYACFEQYNVINHFINSGLINEEWNDINIEDMYFYSYEQSEEEEFPIIDKNEKIEITLYIEEDTREILIQHPFKIKIGKYEKGTKINYKDYDGRDNFFYIDELLKYDIWKKTIDDIEKNIEHVDEEYKDIYRKDILLGLENTCPKGMDYTAIYYESEENNQLRFLTREYLEDKPVYTNSSTSMLWLCGEGDGINGYVQYTDGIKPVEKDFDGEIDIELFSKYIRIPKEKITF